MLIAFSVAPSGAPSDPAAAASAVAESADGSVHDAVAAAVQIVRASGLPHRTTSMFTEVEGEWDEVFAVVKAATEAVLPFGSRVSLVLKADIRPGRTGEIDGKVCEHRAARAGSRRARRARRVAARRRAQPARRSAAPARSRSPMMASSGATSVITAVTASSGNTS